MYEKKPWSEHLVPSYFYPGLLLWSSVKLLKLKLLLFIAFNTEFCPFLSFEMLNCQIVVLFSLLFFHFFKTIVWSWSLRSMVCFDSVSEVVLRLHSHTLTDSRGFKDVKWYILDLISDCIEWWCIEYIVPLTGRVLLFRILYSFSHILATWVLPIWIHPNEFVILLTYSLNLFSYHSIAKNVEFIEPIIKPLLTLGSMLAPKHAKNWRLNNFKISPSFIQSSLLHLYVYVS